MLSKINRIKKKKDFEAIFKKGKSFKNGFLMLKVLPNSLGINRFAFIISLKVSKSAVVRNKIRRRISEVVRLQLDSFKDSSDNVFVALPGLNKKSFQETKELAEQLLKKAKN